MLFNQQTGIRFLTPLSNRVGTAVGGVPEIIMEGETGWLVPPQDAETLTATLLSALADRTRLESMGSNATRFAKDFDLPLIAGRFLSLFQNATSYTY